MKRSKPMRRSPLRPTPGKPLVRKTRLQSGGRLKVKGKSKRFAARRCEPFLEWVRGLPCIHGCPAPSDPHHVRGRKLDDIGSVVPLCRSHHREFHRKGIKTVEREWDTDLMMRAGLYALRWMDRYLNEQGET